MTDNVPVDLSYLEEYTDGDPEVMAELLEAFKETSQEAMDALRAAVAQSDMASWKAAAHKLKGASGYVGAQNLRTLCAASEQVPEDEANLCSELLKKIDQGYNDVCAYLEASSE